MRHTGHRTPRESGAVIVEFAAVAVVFILLLTGMISYGMIFAVQQMVTHAAADAARSTVGTYPDAAAAESRVTGAFADQFPDDGWPNTSYLSDPQVSFGACSGGDGECITVSVEYDTDGLPTLLPENLTPNRLSSSAVVRWD